MTVRLMLFMLSSETHPLHLHTHSKADVLPRNEVMLLQVLAVDTCKGTLSSDETDDETSFP